jgi:hypothetical protein
LATEIGYFRYLWAGALMRATVSQRGTAAGTVSAFVAGGLVAGELGLCELALGHSELEPTGEPLPALQAVAIRSRSCSASETDASALSRSAPRPSGGSALKRLPDEDDGRAVCHVTP